MPTGNNRMGRQRATYARMAAFDELVIAWACSLRFGGVAGQKRQTNESFSSKHGGHQRPGEYSGKRVHADPDAVRYFDQAAIGVMVPKVGLEPTLEEILSLVPLPIGLPRRFWNLSPESNRHSRITKTVFCHAARTQYANDGIGQVLRPISGFAPALRRIELRVCRIELRCTR